MTTLVPAPPGGTSAASGVATGAASAAASAGASGAASGASGAAAGRPPQPAAWRFTGPAVVVIVFLAWCAVHVLTGTPSGDLLAWVGAVTVGVLLPGTALVRALRLVRAPLIEDLAWGAAAGCLVALLGWVADRLLVWSPGPFVWGPALVLVLLLSSSTRRRVLARPAPGWGPGPSVAMGLSMLVALAWMTTTCLQWLPVNPGRTGVLYTQDTLYQAALVGELRHHLVPEYPFVAGEPLHYHWFLYAILAHLTTRTGVDPFDAALRLGPTTVLPAVLLLAAVVARRLSGQITAGPVAMALLAVVDLSVSTRWGWQGSSGLDGATSPVIGLWRGSPPQELAWLAGLAALGTTVSWLRRSESDRAVPVVLLVPFLILCAGAKSSEPPVLGAGIALALAAALLQRQWAVVGRALLLLASVAVVFESAVAFVYRGGSAGMILRPGARFVLQARELFPGLAGRSEMPAIAVVAAFLVITLPVLPRLAGLIWFGSGRRQDPGTWVSLGVAIGGFVATYLFRHPAQSEIYFFVSAYPLAVVGSAAGLTGMLEGYLRAQAGPRTRRGPLALALMLGAVGAAVLAWTQPGAWPLARWAGGHPLDPAATRVGATAQAWWYLRPLLYLAVVVLVLVAVVLATVVLAGSRSAPGRSADRPGSRPRAGECVAGRRVLVAVTVVPVLVAVLLGTGVYGMSQTLFGTADGTLAQRSRTFVAGAASAGTLPTTQDLVDGGRWLQTHAGVDDIVATNRYCVNTRLWRAGPSRCDAREFSTSAFSERRTLVGGWAYADRILAEAWTQPPPYRKIPFWNPPRLAAQDRLFQAPTPARLTAMYAVGVRWLWADLRDGPVATGKLDRLAQLRYSGPNLRIWRLSP